MNDMFLSIEADKPLGIFWVSREGGSDIFDLEEFLEGSKLFMSKEMADRYCERLQLFIDELKSIDPLQET
jgi:hypothetical protein